jgi:hypothetical protein
LEIHGILLDSIGNNSIGNACNNNSIGKSILLEIHGKIDNLYYNNRKFWNS